MIGFKPCGQDRAYERVGHDRQGGPGAASRAILTNDPAWWPPRRASGSRI